MDRVKPVNYGGELELPSGKVSSQRGKAALPGRVKADAGQGKVQKAPVVNQHYLQHDSSQVYRLQPTDEQQLLLQGTLALKPETKSDPETPTADSLYINRNLLEALMGYGLMEKLASEIILSYPANYLWEKVELTRRQVAHQAHQPTVRNVAGYLRRAIEEDYRTTRQSALTGVLKGNASARRMSETPAWGGPQQAAVNDEGQEDYYQSNAASQEPINDTLTGSVNQAVRQPAAPVTISSQDWKAGIWNSGVTGELDGNPPVNAASNFCGLLWQEMQEDLRARYRVDTASLLDGSQLQLTEQQGERLATVQLKWPWLEREVSLTARSAIEMVLRNKLGPGYKLQFN